MGRQLTNCTSPNRLDIDFTILAVKPFCDSAAAASLRAERKLSSIARYPFFAPFLETLRVIQHELRCEVLDKVLHQLAAFTNSKFSFHQRNDAEEMVSWFNRSEPKMITIGAGHHQEKY
jgi:hypothetical protein